MLRPLVGGRGILPSFSSTLVTYAGTVKKAEPSLPRNLFDSKSLSPLSLSPLSLSRTLSRPAYQWHLLTLRAPSEHSILQSYNTTTFDSMALRLSDLLHPSLSLTRFLPSFTSRVLFPVPGTTRPSFLPSFLSYDESTSRYKQRPYIHTTVDTMRGDYLAATNEKARAR